MSHTLQYHIVDAFTSEAFGGNPAAVIVLPPDSAQLDDRTLQLIAREFNLSETAFLVPLSEAGSYRLRWFTPNSEVELCGHATLAAAQILFATSDVGRSELLFETVFSGTLRARRIDDYIELDFPADTPTLHAPANAEQVISVYKAACPALQSVKIEGAYKTRAGNLLHIDLPPDRRLRDLTVDPSVLTKLEGRQQAITCTAPASDKAHDVHSRMFAPTAGVNEDPVTGSLHCSLAPFWRAQLGEDVTATEAKPLRAFQASERGGTLLLVVADDRVKLRGHAVTVMEGTLRF